MRLRRAVVLVDLGEDDKAKCSHLIRPSDQDDAVRSLLAGEGKPSRYALIDAGKFAGARCFGQPPGSRRYSSSSARAVSRSFFELTELITG